MKSTTVLIIGLLVTVALAGGAIAHEDHDEDPLVSMSLEKDSTAKHVAVSGSNDAECLELPCLALSGTGQANGSMAVSVTGSADSCDDYDTCLAISGTGHAHGYNAVSGCHTASDLGLGDAVCSAASSAPAILP